MSSHYLIDAHTIPITSGDINEVRYNVTESPLMGTHVIRVSESMPLSAEPSNLSSLLQSKYNAMLAFYATFSNIVFEDFTDTPGVDLANSTNVHAGIRSTTKVGGTTGVLRTNASVLGAPTGLVVVLWEAYKVITTNPKTGRLTRLYQEMDADSFDVEISFNNGATWTAVTDRAIQNIAAPDQGTDLVLRFTNTSAVNSYWLGSWAVLF